MRPLLTFALLVALTSQIAAPAFAARRVVVRQGHGPRHRTTVVVRRGWPLRRPARVVFVRPARTVVRVRPARYLAPVVFVGAVVAVPVAASRDGLAWQDGENLRQEDDWSELTLNANARGTRLWLQVASGRVQLDWAEVVYDNGDAAVVDFQEKTQGPGLYALMKLPKERSVDHVRVVARARTDGARIVLKMEK